MLDRLCLLETEQKRWQAEVEALLLRAEGKLQAASNAEARARTMKKHAEKLTDPFDIEGEEGEEAVPEGYAPRSEEEWVQPLRVGVAPNHKANALRYKFR